MKDYQWNEVYSNSRNAVLKTKSYSEAIAFAAKSCELWQWDKEVYEHTLAAIDLMYSRKGALTIGKLYDK